MQNVHADLGMERSEAEIMITETFRSFFFSQLVNIPEWLHKKGNVTHKNNA